MKKGIFACLVASVFIGNPLSFNSYRPSSLPQASIKGRITPVSGAESVCVFAAKDSIKSAVVWGNFSLRVKPGTYTLIVKAKDPYKDVLLGNLEVRQDRVLDIGEIILQK